MRWVQLCGSLSILWHCLSLGLEWKRTFSSPVATAQFSKFAGILSAALSQHHLSGFKIAQLEFHHLHELCSYWCFLRPTWLHIPGCLALGEWSHHRDYLVVKIFLYSSSVYSCHLFWISSASVRSLPFLSFIELIFAWNIPLLVSRFSHVQLFVILECEVRWALESITMNKASGGDGIPVELFQILKDDAVKVLHSICQQIWKTQQ